MNRVRSKLNEFGKVKGLAFGYYSEMSQDVSELIELLVKAKRSSVMESLGLYSPEEATSWTRKAIMRSLGWGISLGWSILKIKVFHEAVEYGWDKWAETRTNHRFRNFGMQEMNWEITSVIVESRVGEWKVKENKFKYNIKLTQ